MSASVCGPFLDDCRCRYTQTDDPRSRAEMEARHRESVKRAARSDAGLALPVPTPNMAGRQRTAQAVSRPSLRETRRAA